MTGYTIADWSDFFVATSGAAGVLTGLIFVAVSVNIGTMLEADRETGSNLLTGRALEALVALVGVLVVSLVGLTPAIPRGVFAAWILVVATVSLVSPLRSRREGRSDYTPRGSRVLRLVMAGGLVVGLVVSGVTLAAGHGGGLYWLPFAFVVAVGVAAVNAWVLLVEVLR